MTSARRTTFNFALDHALYLAAQWKKPLVVLEPLRVGYRWASDRLHAFVLQGMADNQAAFSKAPVTYWPFVEEKAGDGSGLVEALAGDACCLVGDDWPCFFVPRMQAAVAKRLKVKFEVVDSNGLWPMHATERLFTTAHSFRAHLQKQLPAHLGDLPCAQPLEGLQLPKLKSMPGVLKRWPRASAQALAASPAFLSSLPIDHRVAPVRLPGGSVAGSVRLERFVTKRLAEYPDARNEPEVEGTSGLSPYLHFGHVSTHQLFAAITEAHRWNPSRLAKPNGGSKEGWWGLPPAVEAFLDEVVTWRELAFNLAALKPDALTTLETLPAWAIATHAKHAKDPRPYRYSVAELEAGQTHDVLWNAAMGQMRQEGWFHNYLRMLWGKKVLEWSTGPLEALATMEQLMNRWSLDGRDPCSYAGYLWVLGRADRAWGPERAIFGNVRYMSSDNTAKKLKVKNYIARYARGA
jgi:deoxyribodipyrimidine photo-lyase